MSNNRLDIPNKDLKWEEIWYHPEDRIISAGYNFEEYYKKNIPGCRIEVVEENLGMKYLSNTLKYKLIYPDDWKEMYVDPLATIHLNFWNIFDKILWNLYSSNKITQTTRAIHNGIHSMIAEIYWESNYKDYTPYQWVERLNKILDFTENNRLSKVIPWHDNIENILKKFREKLELYIKIEK